MARFMNQAIGLISGNAAGQIISFATLPLVTRFYSPEDFGLFSVFLSIMMIAGPVSTLRYNEVILLPRTEAEGYNVVALSIISSFFVSLLVFGAVALLAIIPSLSEIMSVKVPIVYFWLLPFGVLLWGATMSFTQLAERQTKFGKLAFLPILTTSISRALAIALAFLFQAAPLGLIAGRLTGLLAGLILLVSATTAKLGSEIWKAVSVQSMKALATRYKNFAVYGPWAILLHNSSREIIVFIVVSFFSPAVAGFYALGKNMIQAPMQIIGLSINSIFRQRAVLLVDDHVRLVDETRKLVTYMAYLALPFILILLVLGDWLFALLFGAEWLEAGVYAQILAPSFFFVFLYTILRAFFIIKERPKDRLVTDCLFFASRAGSLLTVAILTHSARISLLSLSVVTCIFVSCFLLYITRLLKLELFFFVKIVMFGLIRMSPLAMGFIAVRYLILPHVFWSTLALTLILCLQVIITISRDSFLQEALKIFFAGKRKRFSI